MTSPFEISDAFTEAWARLMPIEATTFGIAGHDDECTDFSPDGFEERDHLYRATRGELAPFLDHPHPDQAFAALVLTGWLDGQMNEFDTGKWRRDLNHIASPFQHMRDVFDLMARESVEEWETITTRLHGFGGMLEGYRQSLQAGLDAGDTVALRQVESLAEQVEIAASDRSPFLSFPEAALGASVDSEVVGRAVDLARTACAGFASWVRDEYRPRATSSDSVGRERYLEGVDEFLGMTIDPEETYDWGWSEVRRLREEMEKTAADIDPGKTIGEVIEMLDTDPARAAATRQDFVDFVSGIQDQAIAHLSGEHFDVPEELQTVTVNIAPPGGSLGAWYNSPTEDFSRPGSIWYAPGEREAIPYWQEVSTAYHEGFPGHHLQVGTAVAQRERLSRFHRSVIWYSGSGEGWALYAERLMDELGYFEKPEYRLGLLASQLFRSIRVVVDIGCQLELAIPDNAPLHAGDTWDYERAVDYMNHVGLQARDVAVSEVKRYLGWWGQAISYKVGEREILAMRERARGAESFDLKGFHRRMLNAGAIRLDHLWQVME